MSSQRSEAGRRRARPVFEGPSYTAPNYRSRVWGRVIFLLFLVLLCGVIGGGGGLYWLLHKPAGSATRAVAFSVGAGDSVGTVANRLRNDGLISNSLLFKLDARLQNLSGKLKPGVFHLRASMSIDQVVSTLSVFRPVFVSVVVPEGYRSEEIAAALQRQGVASGSFLKEVAHPSAAILKNSILADKPASAGLEGYLFPNTYDVQPHSGGRAFADLMVQQLGREITPSMRAAIHREGKTIFQVLTLASIVEREAQVARDRPIIASVYLNRLRVGMMLQADPTVQYAQGASGNWWPVLRVPAATLSVTSPYNTYHRLGLPPGPIANPGLSSIKAVIYPSHTHFLYFIAIPHGHGRDAFAVTYAQQLANEAKYGI